MKLSEVEKFLEWEQAFGACEVLGDVMIPEDGFQIGGNAAAGCACLHAAVEETKEVETEPWDVQNEVEKLCCCLRWSDDLVHMWDVDIKQRTRALLERMREEKSAALDAVSERASGMSEMSGVSGLSRRSRLSRSVTEVSTHDKNREQTLVSLFCCCYSSFLLLHSFLPSPSRVW